MSLWVTLDAPVQFNGREYKALCFDGKRADADAAVAKHFPGRTIQQVQSLPYPAHPRLDATDCPSFCSYPQQCAGHSSCPRNYSCTE